MVARKQRCSTVFVRANRRLITSRLIFARTTRMRTLILRAAHTPQHCERAIWRGHSCAESCRDSAAHEEKLREADRSSRQLFLATWLFACLSNRPSTDLESREPLSDNAAPFILPINSPADVAVDSTATVIKIGSTAGLFGQATTVDETLASVMRRHTRPRLGVVVACEMLRHIRPPATFNPPRKAAF